MPSKQYAAWLQYSKIKPGALSSRYQALLANIVVDESSEALDSALSELSLAAEFMLGFRPAVSRKTPDGAYVRLGTIASGIGASYGIEERKLAELGPEGYLLKTVPADPQGQENALLIIGGSDIGVLYGVFHLLRRMSCAQPLEDVDIAENPRSQLRLINQWDNADGSIERGYAGNSIFYRNNQIMPDASRIRDYARLLASVGINGISINNVNVFAVETAFITPRHLPAVAKVAHVFRAYGIRLYLSINFAAPIEAGGLSTADPLADDVRRWWSETAADIYRHIPDFGGFVVKADSERRPGPFTYGRNHADGANMLAEALEPYGGLVIWRCFVYNCLQDWRDRSTDRARAAYDHFMPLDGAFRDNVVLQIKNGPMDFQVREPVSPLFGALTRTNQMMEFQITQEYTGHQKHLCYLVPQWKEALDFDTHAGGEGSLVSKAVDGTLFGAKYSGYAAVSNIGDDENWTGHTLAQANLYGYGRLIWDPELSAEKIAEEWAGLTFGGDERVRRTVTAMLMGSWRTYEKYTAPLGVGWMVTPHTHYGPDVDGYEYSKWGTYHFADRDGIGVDRTAATGTGYAAQYHAPNAQLYEELHSCPDELLLFFHHVPYAHILQSGETVIQHIYNTHFEGAEEAERLRLQWESLADKIDAERYLHVLSRLEEQAEHAKHWRDVINTYFYRKAGVPDAHGRTIY